MRHFSCAPQHCKACRQKLSFNIGGCAQIVGTLPLAWGRPGALKSLQLLNIWGNLISGSLPPSWCALFHCLLPAVWSLIMLHLQASPAVRPQLAPNFFIGL